MFGWREFQSSPAYLINLDRRPERLQASLEALREAGFREVRRWQAVDVSVQDQDSLVARLQLGDAVDVDGFLSKQGAQGCLLSHLAVIEHAISSGYEMVHIFEDDLHFPSFWRTHSEAFFAATPRDWMLLFMGSQIDFAYLPGINSARILAKCRRTMPFFPMFSTPRRICCDIVRLPVFCTHAYSLTRAGCLALYDWLTRQKCRYAYDFMLYDGMRGHQRVEPLPLNWYAWNSMRLFPQLAERGKTIQWIRRNTGLVFQAEDHGSDILLP